MVMIHVYQIAPLACLCHQCQTLVGHPGIWVFYGNQTNLNFYITALAKLLSNSSIHIVLVTLLVYYQRGGERRLVLEYENQNLCIMLNQLDGAMPDLLLSGCVMMSIVFVCCLNR